MAGQVGGFVSHFPVRAWVNSFARFCAFLLSPLSAQSPAPSNDRGDDGTALPLDWVQASCTIVASREPESGHRWLGRYGRA